MWEEFVHTIYDVFYLFQWLLDGLQALFSIIFTPLVWIFNFGKGFLFYAFKTPQELGIEPLTFGFGSAIAFFNSFPYLTYIFTGVGAGLGLLFLAFIAKHLT